VIMLKSRVDWSRADFKLRLGGNPRSGLEIELLRDRCAGRDAAEGAVIESRMRPGMVVQMRHGHWRGKA
jgi:hypothetical protein